MKAENVRFIIILCLFILLYIFILNRNSNNEDDVLLEKINGLELKLDSLSNKKDSIREVIDSTHVKIITNEKHYKEVVNTIISQPTDSDYVFIANYIRQYRNQNDSTNLCRTSNVKE